MAITPPRNSKASYTTGNDNLSRLKSQIVSDFVHKSDIRDISSAIKSSITVDDISIIVDGPLEGQGTTSNHLRLIPGTIIGQVLKWNGYAWTADTDDVGVGGDNWGTQVASVSYPLSGDGTVGLPIKISDGGSLLDVMMWDGSSWDASALPDQEVLSPLEGSGKAGNPLKLVDGTIVGQVLKWNGLAWVADTDDIGTDGDNWGTQVAETSGMLEGDGTVGDEIRIKSGTTIGNVLTWDGSQWSDDPLPSFPPIVVESDGMSVFGDGSSGNKLRMVNGVSEEDYLIWDDTFKKWNSMPLNVYASSLQFDGTGNSGAPLQLTEIGITDGNLFQVSGGTWVKKDLTLSTELAGTGIAVDELRLAQQGASVGDLMSWNGTQWVPVTIDTTLLSTFTVTYNCCALTSNLTGSMNPVTTSYLNKMYVPAGYTNLKLSLRITDSSPTGAVNLEVVGTRSGLTYTVVTGLVTAADSWHDITPIVVGDDDEYTLYARKTAGTGNIKIGQVYATMHI